MSSEPVENPDHSRTNLHAEESEQAEGEAEEPPIFNLPRVVTAFIGLLVLIHLVRTYLISPQTDNAIILLFAFIPASYGELAASMPFPASAWWSPLIHAFLHGNWAHLIMNIIWMAAFASPVAIRFGIFRFSLFTVVVTLCGALLHYVSYPGEFVPVIGASGAVSGYMGAAGRFAFNNMGRGPGRFDPDGPALTLLQSFTNRPFIAFFAVWMVINFLAGSGIVAVSGQEAGIAWQAHIGGFIGGILFFSVFDPKSNHGFA